MNREEYLRKFRKNVDWLKINIEPEDIYDFAEQAILAAEFFLDKWNQWEDVTEICKKNPVAHVYVSNITGIRKLKDIRHVDGINVHFDWNED